MLKIFFLPVLLFLQQEQHLTMSSIEYVPGTDSLKVFVKFDYNLFLQDYQQTMNDDINLDPYRNQRPFPSDMTNNYINSKVTIYANGDLLLGKLIKIEKSEGSVNLSILYRVKKKPKILQVKNTFLTGLYSDVENLAIIKVGDLERGIKFTLQHTEEKITLK